jgi:tetratricopeptide (TPR) repeat protein
MENGELQGENPEYIVQGLKTGIEFAADRERSISRPFLAAGLLLALAIGIGQAQQTVRPLQTQSPPAQTAATSENAPASDEEGKPSKPTRTSDRRRAAKLYLASSKLFADEKFEEALRGYEEAAKLDPSNAEYQLAVGVTLSHAVEALIQAAAKDRMRGDAAAAREALARAVELDPTSPLVAEHLNELGDDALLGLTTPHYEQGAKTLGEAVELEPKAGVRSFHLHTAESGCIEQVFKAYGLEATLDQSVKPTQMRLDLDDASFEQAMDALRKATKTFYVPLDAHRVLVAADSNENRQQYTRRELETVYLSGLTAPEMTDVLNIVRNVFEAQQATVNAESGTLTVRAPESTLDAINATLSGLMEGHNQVMLEVRVIQLAHTSQRNSGVQLPQQVTAFNAYSAEQSILNANQAAVQKIVSSGLAAPGDTLAILGILLASGAATSSIFSNGIALFGNGLTLSGISPQPITMNISLNSSDSRELDQIQMHLGDGEDGTLKLGTRYPIQTSSFSGLSTLPNIPGLTGAGSSSSLSSLLSSIGGSVPSVPQVQYQDLGLTLKVTPKVMRDDDVALKIDMKIDALAGSSINGNPILNNRSYSGVVTLPQGQGAIVASELDKQQSRAISGLPGIGDIPGLNNVDENNVQKSYATLLIVMTPHVIRFTQSAGHTPMMRVEKSLQAH